MDTIKFADGAVYDCSYMATADGIAFVALSGVSFAEAAAVFSDPAKTSEMEYGDYRLIDFINLAMLTAQPYGYQAVLKGGHVERKGQSA